MSIPRHHHFWEFALLLFFFVQKGKWLDGHVLAHCSPAGKSLNGSSTYLIPTARHRQRLQGPRANKAASAKLPLYHSSTRIFINPFDQTQEVTSGASSFSSRPTSAVTSVSQPVSSMPGLDPDVTPEPAIPPLYLNVLNPRARSISLTPRDSENVDLTELPEKKLPGETHIFDMHVGLRTLIIKQLSRRKGNGECSCLP
ncbi:hypothetical protein ElyMa_003091200 [Elysia marginata]|uniref:Uncharacterized protein n=1 Tax=Elysia marginata TaxID=1093978 RepID=A0AAV4IQE2_9GAST|nr:hypothetical protein ElyMa_003091200 [Elysia marginata]